MTYAACSTQDDFKAAAEEAKTLPSNVSNEDQARVCVTAGLPQPPCEAEFQAGSLTVPAPPFSSPAQLLLYGLFKQANTGDNTTGTGCPSLCGRVRAPPQSDGTGLLAPPARLTPHTHVAQTARRAGWT